jgi:hypothetical protein
MTSLSIATYNAKCRLTLALCVEQRKCSRSSLYSGTPYIRCSAYVGILSIFITIPDSCNEYGVGHCSQFVFHSHSAAGVSRIPTISGHYSDIYIYTYIYIYSVLFT